MNVPEINRNAADPEDDGGLDPEAYEFITEEQRKEPEVDVSLGLEGKVILVTGGNRGIGRRIVLLLEALGAKVAFTDRSDHKRDHGSLILHADVTYPGEMERVVETIEAELGPLYGVVANAGITRDGMFHKMTHRDWDAVLNVNLSGVYNTVRPAFPVMRDHGEGSIVLISSIIGVRGGLGQVNYAASKAGLIGLGKSLAAEGARKGVRTNIVAPGFVATDMTKVLPDNVQEAITSEIPLGRFGLPLEIAWPVAMLLSPTAGGYINGEVVNVNGGHLM